MCFTTGAHPQPLITERLSLNYVSYYFLILKLISEILKRVAQAGLELRALLLPPLPKSVCLSVSECLPSYPPSPSLSPHLCLCVCMCVPLSFPHTHTLSFCF